MRSSAVSSKQCFKRAGAVNAHHSQAGLFDPGTTIEVTGIVKSVSWRNPHGHIIFTVSDEAGTAVDWDAETASIAGSPSRLDYRITVTDPVYFSEPFDLTRYFVWKPENIVHPYECEERYL